MEPVTIMSLIAACATIATKLVSTIKDLSNLVTQFKDAAKSISYLSADLLLLKVVVVELKKWLERSIGLQLETRQALATAIKSCNVITEDIAVYVDKVKPGKGEKASEAKLKKKIRLLWNDTTIKDHRAKLLNTFQAFHLLVSLTQRAASSPDFDSLIKRSEVKEVIRRSSEDANSIPTPMMAIPSRNGSASTDNGSNLDKELYVDEEITRSGPYVRNQRYLMRQRYGASAASPRRSVDVGATLGAIPSGLQALSELKNAANATRKLKEQSQGIENTVSTTADGKSRSTQLHRRAPLQKAPNPKENRPYASVRPAAEPKLGSSTRTPSTVKHPELLSNVEGTMRRLMVPEHYESKRNYRARQISASKRYTPRGRSPLTASETDDESDSSSNSDYSHPATISTRGHQSRRSQPSLLVEYLDNGKFGHGGTTEQKPSIRLQLVPSKDRKRALVRDQVLPRRPGGPSRANAAFFTM